MKEVVEPLQIAKSGTRRVLVACPDRRITFLHILPNVLAPVIVLSTLSIAGAILAASGLSFIGLCAQPPTQ